MFLKMILSWFCTLFCLDKLIPTDVNSRLIRCFRIDVILICPILADISNEVCYLFEGDVWLLRVQLFSFSNASDSPR